MCRCYRCFLFSSLFFKLFVYFSNSLYISPSEKIFSLENEKKRDFFCILLVFLYLCTRPSQLHEDWAGHDIDGILRPTMPFVGQAEGKGVYGRYHSVCSNFAPLKLSIEIMQRDVYVGRLYPSYTYI